MSRAGRAGLGVNKVYGCVLFSMLFSLIYFILPVEVAEFKV
jgi:hypothetical protein